MTKTMHCPKVRIVLSQNRQGATATTAAAVPTTKAMLIRREEPGESQRLKHDVVQIVVVLKLLLVVFCGSTMLKLEQADFGRKQCQRAPRTAREFEFCARVYGTVRSHVEAFDQVMLRFNCRVPRIQVPFRTLAHASMCRLRCLNICVAHAVVILRIEEFRQTPPHRQRLQTVCQNEHAAHIAFRVQIESGVSLFCRRVSMHWGNVVALVWLEFGDNRHCEFSIGE